MTGEPTQRRRDPELSGAIDVRLGVSLPAAAPRLVENDWSHDPIGGRTLAALSGACRYAEWQLTQLRPNLGKRILEVGSGIGNIATQLLNSAPERLVLSDQNPYYLEHLRALFSSQPQVSIRRLALPGADPDEWRAECLDTVVAFNVLEHIEDHVGALRELRELVAPGGRLMLLVPAHQALYGSLDRSLGHWRRYSTDSCRTALIDAGWKPLSLRYFNVAGALGWWWRGSVRRKRELSAAAIRAFDSMVPALRLEDRVTVPFGLSVVAAAER